MFASMQPLDADVQRAYLARLDVAAEPPSVAALQQLVQRHAERVPYETLWIQSGQAWSIDPYEAAVRIATRRRGGYCYHVNGALGLLLHSLGYAVHGHVGGVHGPDGPTPDVTGNHLVLTVDGLPTDANPGGVWYLDNGLGDALHDALPLVAGQHDQPPFRLSLERVENGWHLTHDPKGGFTGMTWTEPAAKPADFEAKHKWLSTAPESGFVQVATAQLRDSTGVDVVRGLVLSRIGDNARVDEPVERRSAWFELLADVFALTLDDMTSTERDTLWSSVLDGHRRWLEAQTESA